MTENAKDSAMIIGEVASSGVARGPAFVCACAEDTVVPRRTIEASEALTEMERFSVSGPRSLGIELRGWLRRRG